MKYSIVFTILLIGVLTFGLTQYMPPVYAAQSDIGTIAETLTLDSDAGTTSTVEVIQISGNTFAAVWVEGTNGKIATFTVSSSNGNISDAVIAQTGDDVVTFDATVANPEIIHISGSVYAVVYESGNEIHADTFTITSAGVITEISADNQLVTTFTTDADDPDLVHVKSGTNSQVYAIAYEDGTSVDIATVNFPNSGAAPSIVEQDQALQATSENPAIIKIDTGIYAVAYVSTADNTADVETFAISDTGDITIGTVDTFDLHGGANAIDGDTHLDITHVTQNIYAAVYSDGDDLHVETFDIDAAGNIGSQQAIADVEINSADTAKDPQIIQTDIGINPINFVVAYYDSASDAGELVSVTITPNGGTITGHGGDSDERLTYDSSGGQAPSLAHRGPTNAVTGQTNFYVVGYSGSAAVSSFNLGDKNDTTAPTLTAVRLSSNNPENTLFVNEGDTITLTVVGSEPITITAATINGVNVVGTAANPSENTHTVTKTVSDGTGGNSGTEPESTEANVNVTFSISFRDNSPQQNAGTAVTSVTDGRTFVVDNNPPGFTAAEVVGTDAFVVAYDEIIISESTANYGTISIGGNGKTVQEIAGNGTRKITVITDQTDLANSDAGTFNLVASATNHVDRAGNQVPASAGETITAANADGSATQITTSAANPVVGLTTTGFVTSIVSTAVAPQLSLGGLDGGDADTETITVAVTVDSATADLEFAAATTVDNLPEDKIIDIGTSTKTATGVSGTIGTIIEVGDPDVDITFSNPVKVTLPGEAGNTAFIINAAGTTEIVSRCSAVHANAAAAAVADVTAVTEECAIDENGNKTFWTRHFSGFGTASPAAVSSSGGGGPSGPHGDTTPPSLLAQFASDEYPIEFDGVKYSSNNLESFHTAMVKTGEEFEATIRIYDNLGPQNVQHAELYVNHPIDRILNDLTETIIVYDAPDNIEIVDPHNLISSATVVPATAGDKAEFNFKVIFEKEFDLSGMIFRLWDVQRNPIEIYLPNSLVVVPGNVVSPDDAVLSAVPGLVEEVTPVEPLSTVLEKSITTIEETTITKAVKEQIATNLAMDIEVVEEILSGEQIASDEFLASFTDITGVVATNPEPLGTVLANNVDASQIDQIKEQLAWELVVDIEVVEEILSGEQIASDEFLASFTDITGVVATNPEPLGTVLANAVTTIEKEKVIEIITEQIANDLSVDVETVDGILTGTQEPSNEFYESFEELTGVVTVKPESVPEDPINKYTDKQMSVLQQWGGYDVQSATDKDVLNEFNIKGDHIPSWYKNTVKWFVDGFLDKKSFVNALKNLESRGFLSETGVSPTTETTFTITGTGDLEELQSTGKLQLEFAENNNIVENVNISSLEDKILTIHAISNNEQIREIILDSNEEFAGKSDLGILISERNIIWMDSLDEPTMFMEDTLNNRGAMIAKAIIETQQDESIPIQKLIVTNAYGVNVILSELTDNYVNTDTKWWEQGLSDGLYVTIGNTNDGFTGQYLGEITIPIYDADGNFIGMLNAQVDLKNTLLGQ